MDNPIFVKKIKTYIVIVTYNAMPWLKACLESCAGYAVIVIDNYSSDETVEYISKKFPQVHLIPQSENLGFGRANNIGISYALKDGADYVYLLNQDAYLELDTIEKLLQVQNKYPEYGILSPIHINAQKTKLDRNFSVYVRFDKNASFYSDYILQKKLSDVYSFPFINAAGWLLSRKCLTMVGGFDPMFFLYGEDDNYCQRALFHGYKIGVVPNCFMVHDREDRPNPKKEKDYKKVELGFKYRLGNINNPAFELSVKHEFNKLRRAVFTQILQLKFSRVLYIFKCRRVLKSILPEVNESRNLTRIKGPHYLNL